MISVQGHEIGSDAITLIVAAVCVIISFAQQWRCRKRITTTDSVASLLNPPPHRWTRHKPVQESRSSSHSPPPQNAGAPL